MVDVQSIETNVAIRIQLAKAETYINHVMKQLPDNRDDASIEALLGMLDKAGDSMNEIHNLL